MRFLVETNLEESDQLQIILYFLVLNMSAWDKKKVKGIFGSAIDPTKEKEYQEKITLENFKAYFLDLGTVLLRNLILDGTLLKKKE